MHKTAQSPLRPDKLQCSYNLFLNASLPGQIHDGAKWYTSDEGRK